MRWIRMLLPDETDFENIGRMIGEGGWVGCLECFSLLVHLSVDVAGSYDLSIAPRSVSVRGV